MAPDEMKTVGRGITPKAEAAKNPPTTKERIKAGENPASIIEEAGRKAMEQNKQKNAEAVSQLFLKEKMEAVNARAVEIAAQGINLIEKAIHILAEGNGSTSVEEDRERLAEARSLYQQSTYLGMDDAEVGEYLNGKFGNIPEHTSNLVKKYDYTESIYKKTLDKAEKAFFEKFKVKSGEPLHKTAEEKTPPLTPEQIDNEITSIDIPLPSEWTEEDEETLAHLEKIIADASLEVAELTRQLAEMDEKENAPANTEESSQSVQEEENKLAEQQKEIRKKIDLILDELTKLYGQRRRPTGLFFTKKGREERSFQNDLIKKINNLEAENSTLYAEDSKLHEKFMSLEEKYWDLRKTEEDKRAQEKIKEGEVAKEALEKDRKENPFKYFLIDEMSGQTVRCMFNTDRQNLTLENVNSIMTSPEVTFWQPKFIISSHSDTVQFSSNGFTLQLINKEEVRGENGIDVDSPKAKYKLVSPGWKYFENETSLGYEEGIRLLEKRSQEYQKHMLEKFNNGNK